MNDMDDKQLRIASVDLAIRYCRDQEAGSNADIIELAKKIFEFVNGDVK